MLDLQAVLSQLEGVKQTKDGYMARCPAHADQNPSLSIKECEGKLLLHCFAGCAFEQVVAALDNPVATNHRLACSKDKVSRTSKGELEASYNYEDEKGILLYQSLRYASKHFRFRRPDPNGGWLYSLGETRKVLYNLRNCLEAISKGEVIYLCEGEKDANAVINAGAVATTNCGGALAWEDSYSEALTSARVIAVIDKDRAGAERAAMLAERLAKHTRSLEFVEAREGKDAFDHLEAGYGLGAFVPYAAPVPESAGLLTLGQLYDLPTKEVHWTVEGIIPTGSLAVVVAKPKVGKSTFLRELMRCVATGQPFLGRKVDTGPVIYFALEERVESLVNTFQGMGLGREVPLHIATSKQNLDLKQLENEASRLGAKLVVIDTLFTYIEVDDANDYAKGVKAMRPLVEFARNTDVTIIVTHHARKGPAEDVGDSTLGSTAIFGSVDTLIQLRKDTNGHRFIESDQRYGENLESTELHFDLLTHRVTLGELKSEVTSRQDEAKLLALIESRGGPVSAEELEAELPRMKLRRLLPKLVQEGKLERSGAGKKGSPYLYSAVPTITAGPEEMAQ